MFEFKDIEVLQQIVKAGGFRAAAQKYGISQATLSARVAALEKRLDTTLFDRSSRKVRLTAAGLRFLEESQRLLQARDRIWHELTHSGGLSGTVRIGVAETIVHTILSDSLNKLKNDFPTARFELSVDTSGQLATALANDDLDVAILLREFRPQGAVAFPLRPVRLGWYGPENMVLPDRALSLTELAEYAIITFPRGTPPCREVERIFSAPDIAFPALHGSASLSVVKHLISKGFGIGVLPTLMTEDPSGEDRVKPIPVCDQAYLSDLHFAVSYFPERNREIGEAIAGTVRLFDQSDR